MKKLFTLILTALIFFVFCSGTNLIICCGDNTLIKEDAVLFDGSSDNRVCYTAAEENAETYRIGAENNLLKTEAGKKRLTGYSGRLSRVPWFWLTAVAVVIGFAAAIITVSVMKSRLKSVRFQSAAGDYVRDGSFNLTDSNDRYLYCTVTRTERPKQSDNSGKGNI